MARRLYRKRFSAYTGEWWQEVRGLAYLFAWLYVHTMGRRKRRHVRYIVD